MSHAGFYDHLNETTPVTTEVNLDALALTLIESNYGVHRFLSALVRQAKIANRRKTIIDSIENLLNDGQF
jgi:hypothetical protein